MYCDIPVQGQSVARLGRSRLSLVSVWCSFVMLVSAPADQRTKEEHRDENSCWPGRGRAFRLHRSRLDRSIRENGPIHITPARATDLSGLPPTFIHVGTVDLFHDEDIAFVDRLMQAGVPTELHINPGSYHASETFTPAAALCSGSGPCASTPSTGR